MSDIYFFLSEFFLFCFVIIISSGGAYWTARIMWIIYTNNCFEIFNQKNKIENISFFINEYKYKYLSWFIFFSCFNCLIFIVFLWIWISFKNNIYLTIPFIIIFLVANILNIILIKIFWKKIKKTGFYSKKEAIRNFQIFQKENKNAYAKDFSLLKFNKTTVQNQPFQFQQKRYQRKIKNLTKQKISQEKYDFKLLNLLTKYLKVYAVFLIRIDIKNYSVVIENEKESNVLNVLPDVLINNFFAFVDQAEKEFNNKYQ